MGRRRSSGLGLTEALRSCPELLPTLFGWIVLSSVHDRIGEADPKRLRRLNQLVESRLAASLLQIGIEAEVTASLVSLLRIAVEHGWGRQSALPPQDHILMDQFTDGERVIEAIGTRDSKGDIVLIDLGLRRARDWRMLVETLGWSSRFSPGARLSSRVEKWWSSLDHLYDRAKAVRFRLKALREEATGDPIASLSETDSATPSAQTAAGEKRTMTSE